MKLHEAMALKNPGRSQKSMPLAAIKSMDYHFKAWRKERNIIKSLDKIFHEQDRFSMLGRSSEWQKALIRGHWDVH